MMPNITGSDGLMKIVVTQPTWIAPTTAAYVSADRRCAGSWRAMRSHNAIVATRMIT